MSAGAATAAGGDGAAAGAPGGAAPAPDDAGARLRAVLATPDGDRAVTYVSRVLGGLPDLDWSGYGLPAGAAAGVASLPARPHVDNPLLYALDTSAAVTMAGAAAGLFRVDAEARAGATPPGAQAVLGAPPLMLNPFTRPEALACAHLAGIAAGLVPASASTLAQAEALPAHSLELALELSAHAQLAGAAARARPPARRMDGAPCGRSAAGPDWSALPPEVVLCVVNSAREEDCAGAGGLPLALLLSAACARWRAVLRGTPELWRSLACARACRGPWAHGQPAAVAPAALLRHRLLHRAARAAGVFLAEAQPRNSRLTRELHRLLSGTYGQRHVIGDSAACAFADAEPVLRSVHSAPGGGTRLCFVVLGPYDSPYGGAWLRVNVVVPQQYPLRAAPRCTVVPPLPHAGLLPHGGVLAEAHLAGAHNWSPALDVFHAALDVACLLSQPAWPCAPDAVDAAVARRAAAAALAPKADSAEGDDGDTDKLDVCLPAGRALLRVALYACRAGDGNREHVVWELTAEQRRAAAWACEAPKRERTLRVLRWAAALARAPRSHLDHAMTAELDAAAASGAPPPAYRRAQAPHVRRSAEASWLASLPQGDAHTAALTALADTPPGQLLTAEEEELLRAPTHGVPMQRLVELTLAQLAPAAAAADAAAARDLGLLLLLREAEAPRSVRGAAPRGTAEGLLVAWMRAQLVARTLQSLHAWLELPG